LTYEPISPEEVGNFRRLALGKHSGIHGLKKLLEEQGIYLNDQELREVLNEIKKLAENGEKVNVDVAKEIAIKVSSKKIKV